MATDVSVVEGDDVTVFIVVAGLLLSLMIFVGAAVGGTTFFVGEWRFRARFPASVRDSPERMVDSRAPPPPLSSGMRVIP